MSTTKGKQNLKKKTIGGSALKSKNTLSGQSDVFSSVSTGFSATSSDMTQISQDSTTTNGTMNGESYDYHDEELDEEVDLHLNLEDLDDCISDSSDSDEEEEDIAPTAQKNTKPNPFELPQINISKNAGLLNSQNNALIPFGQEFTEEEEEVDSEEERDIMREIKDEIQQQVRQEMKPEIQYYKTKLEALEYGEISGPGDSKRHKDELLNDVTDPKLRAAILKMRKLDRILAKKMKREIQVKRERFSLERRLREELTAPKPDGGEMNPVIKANADKYLALALPPSHNEGVESSDTPEPGPEPPVFTTQLNEQDYPGVHGKTDKSTKGSSPKHKTDSRRSANTDSRRSPDSLSEIGSETSNTTSSTNTGKKKKNKKNFIKRNKKLAADAEQPIPMTDEEKKRVESLLQDLECLPELPEEFDQLGDDNPFQIAIHPGEGFHPDAAELRSLIHIDSRLKDIMPPDEYESIASQSTVNTPQHRFFTPVTANSDFDFERYGEKALLENKEQRELRERLQRVEEELAKFHNPEELEMETPTKLQEGELNDLIDQCVRSISRTSFADVDSSRCTSTENNTPRTPTSAREQLLENPPYLAPDVLQKLLTDAYCPVTAGAGRNTHLSTLREEEEDDNVQEESMNMDSISAETWKSISEQELDEDDMKLIAHGDLSQITARSLQYTDREQSSRANDNIYNNNYQPEMSERNYYSEVSERSDYPQNYDVDIFRNSSRESANSLWNSYEQKPSQVPVLPKINRTGSLVSQDLNNEALSRSSSVQSARSSVLTVRNSFPGTYTNEQDGLEIMSLGGESACSTPVPRPPSGEKQTNSHVSKSRVVTPSNSSR